MPNKVSSKTLTRRWWPQAVLSGLVAGSLCLPALAGDFTISPIRIYMNPGDRAVAITVTNESDQPLVMQADLYTWSQSPEGEEQLELSEDMFLSPPIIQLGPNERQVVRLARLTRATPTEQMTYRMIAREIIEPTPPVAGTAIEVALALSLPVFITPPNAKSALDCTVLREADAAKVVCENTGSAYAQPRAITLTNATGESLASLETSTYILPGIKQNFDLPADAVIPAGSGKLSITLDDNSLLDFDVTFPE